MTTNPLDEKKTRSSDLRSANTRDAEIRAELEMTYRSPLHVDPHKIPDDKDYYWVRDSFRGQPDHNRMMELARKGWEPVPSYRHPELVPKTMPWHNNPYEGYIYRGGLILCERNKEYGRIEKAALEKQNMDAMLSIPGKENLMAEPTMPMKVFDREVSVRTMQSTKSFGD